MKRWIGITLLISVIFTHYIMAQEKDNVKAAICLKDLDITSDTNLAYIVI